MLVLLVELPPSLICSTNTQASKVRQTIQAGTSHTSNSQKVFVPPDFCYLKHYLTCMPKVGCYKGFDDYYLHNGFLFKQNKLCTPLVVPSEVTFAGITW